MGVYQNLFVGPYAEWLIPEGKNHGLPPSGKDGERLFQERLMCYVEEPGQAFKVGPQDHYRYCYMPDAPNDPGREVYFGGKPAWPPVLDLTKLDRQKEIDWFATAFAEEFKTLAQYFGGPPSLRWGIVCWLS